jgi:AcrR family transcriptional regulator
MQTMPEPQSTSPFNRSVKHQQKLQAILSEAASLFNHQGTRGTTLDDIAQRLGLNKTTLYYYVKTKDELIYRCYLNSCDKIESIIKRANNERQTGVERLTRFIELYFDIWREVALSHAPHYAILWEIPALAESHRKEVAARYSGLFKQVRRMVELGNRDGSLKATDPTSAALAVFGLSQQAMLWLPSLGAEKSAATAARFNEIMLNGLATSTASTSEILPARGLPMAGFDRQAQRLQKQQAFVRAGSAIFNQKGYRGTSLDEIAESLAVTKGAFYYHIKDKEDLLLRCFEQTTQRIAAMQQLAIDQGGNGMDQIARCLAYLFQDQHGDAGALIRFNMLISLPRELRRQVVREMHAIRDRFATMLEIGMADGSIRKVDPFVAERLINGAINTCIELPMVKIIKDPLAAATDFFQLILVGLRNKH